MKISISKKITGALLIGICTYTVSIGMAYLLINDFIKLTREMDITARKVNLAGDLKFYINKLHGPVTDYLITRKVEERDRFDFLINKTSEIFKKLEGYKSSSEWELTADKVKKDVIKFGAMAVDILFIEDPIGNRRAAGLIRELNTSSEGLIKEADEFHNIAKANVERMTNEVEKKRKVVQSLLIIILGIAFVSLVPMSLYLKRFITTPILKLRDGTRIIGSGKLDHRLHIKTGDEIEDLAEGFNLMTVNLKDIISKIGNISNSVANVTSNIASSSKNLLEIADVQKKAVEETASAIEEMDNSVLKVSASTGHLSKSSGDTSSLIKEMSTSMEELAENTDEFIVATQNTTSSIEEMVTNINEIAEGLEKLSAASTQIVSSIEEVNNTTKDISQSANESVVLSEQVMSNASDKGMLAANAAMEGMETIKNNVVTLSDVINTLGKRSNEIGKILNVIDGVADQTNLLALNAAILASKAGEHGRGFAIVANEIKDLAERTSKSTMEIASLIKSVQDEAQSSIRMASESVQTVQNGITLVKGVNNALGDILDSSKVSTEMAKVIQKATVKETNIIGQITGAVEGMNEQIANISRAIKEQSKGSNLIIDAASKVIVISHHFKKAITEQKDASKRVALAAENITQEASMIADSTGKQSEKSAEIVRSMEKIHNTTGNLVTSSNEMHEAINSLKDEALNLLTELKKFKV